MVQKKPMRLPPLDRIYVRNPNKIEKNACLNVMSQVLACWASSGYNVAGCATVEQALRDCMDKGRPPPQSSNTINYHLNRFTKRLTQKPGQK
ncbi:hypothetical protein QBC47DRAFT_396271 [Echria macrotheca]|uniref:Small ribosomal subunit protein mS37 n=1 Tax=Echria macrotheca TaxID=438768 RepID=A0AAJ0FED9_9PEZI|nr:hypothetical protein QBC47DRAFT_396271 [Echria macrotheca]